MSESNEPILQAIQTGFASTDCQLTDIAVRIDSLERSIGSITYRLFFGEIEVATVIEAGADFPNVWGTYSLALGDRSNPEIQKIAKYIEYSIASSRIGEESDYGQESIDFDTANEAQFLDLIESDDWYFIEDETGEKHYLLIPMFHSDCDLGWRWNFDATQER
jgi:hypothetical protein